MTAHQRLEVRIPMALEAYADHARDLVVIQTVAPPHACRSLRSPQLRGDARAVPTGSDQRADPALPPPLLDEARQTPIGFVVQTHGWLGFEVVVRQVPGHRSRR
jgi:hypothetical protein